MVFVTFGKRQNFFGPFLRFAQADRIEAGGKISPPTQPANISQESGILTQHSPPPPPHCPRRQILALLIQLPFDLKAWNWQEVVALVSAQERNPTFL